MARGQPWRWWLLPARGRNFHAWSVNAAGPQTPNPWRERPARQEAGPDRAQVTASHFQPAGLSLITDAAWQVLQTAWFISLLLIKCLLSTYCVPGLSPGPRERTGKGSDQIIGGKNRNWWRDREAWSWQRGRRGAGAGGKPCRGLRGRASGGCVQGGAGRGEKVPGPRSIHRGSQGARR